MILLIRHAETDLAGTFCGHSDPPLNDQGRAQLAALRARVPALTHLYTSDLQRAVETAQAIAGGLPLQLRPALREIYFGDWEALTWPEIEQHDAAYAQRWLDEFPNLPAPNGELYASFQQRIHAELAYIRSQTTGTTAILTHAGVLRTLLEPHDKTWSRSLPHTTVVELPA